MTEVGGHPEGADTHASATDDPIGDANTDAGVDGDETPTAEVRRVADVAEFVGLDRARYDRQALLDKVGLSGDDTRRWWRAMGLVEAPDHVVAFGRDDLKMARALKVVMAQGDASEEHIFRLARLLGGSFSRIAEAQADVLEDILTQLSGPGDLDTPADRAAALLGTEAASLLEVLEGSLLYVWRRHLHAAVGRWVGAEDDEDDLAVGFADISGFSRMSKRMESAPLTALVERFESEAIDVVSAHDGRVVKFIGDEALFVVEDVGTAVDVALELLERMNAGDTPVPLHCGIASGPTVMIGGDVFGETVNFAKRLTDVARRNRVVLSKQSAKELEGRDDLVIHRVRRSFELKGFERTQVVSVSKASG